MSERIHRTNSNEPFLNHLFVVLNEALPRNIFSIDSYSLNPIFFEQAVSAGISDEQYLVYRRYMHQHPLLRRLLIPQRDGVYSILSTTSAEKFHKTDLYQKFYRGIGVEDQLVFILAHSRGVYLIVYSRETAFSARERVIMELLKAQLKIAFKHWRRICDLEQQLQTLETKNDIKSRQEEYIIDAKDRFDRLTPRQRTIAELVAQGMENRQIAEVLYISPKTVGKHLENIFEKLCIHHRAALAAMWRECRLVQDNYKFN